MRHHAAGGCGTSHPNCRAAELFREHLDNRRERRSGLVVVPSSTDADDPTAAATLAGVVKLCRARRTAVSLAEGLLGRLHRRVCACCHRRLGALRRPVLRCVPAGLRLNLDLRYPLLRHPDLLGGLIVLVRALNPRTSSYRNNEGGLPARGRDMVRGGPRGHPGKSPKTEGG